MPNTYDEQYYREAMARGEASMTESREQFRERIWRVFEERQYTYPEVAQSRAAHRAGTEAVYAAALRDLRALARPEHFPGNSRPVHVIQTTQIDRLAASLGIDLEDK